MHAQIFTYVIDLPSQKAYLAQLTDPFAALVAAAKGLYSKVCKFLGMGDQSGYGSIYGF